MNNWKTMYQLGMLWKSASLVVVILIGTMLIALSSPFAQARPAEKWTHNPAVDNTQPNAIIASTDLALGAAHNQAAPLIEAPFIEITQQSGVSGYLIGIFGSGFGWSQGSVSILDQTATIVEWTPTFIHAEIPVVADGTGELRITNVDSQSISQPFEVYSIEPSFQRLPSNRFTNIMRGKAAILENIDTESTYCYEQPDSIYKVPETFLTDFDCGFNGVIGDGTLVATIPEGGSTKISVDLGQELSGTYYFQFFSLASWYANWDTYPNDYEIQISTDSTTGFDGSWQTVHTEMGNNRGGRLHKIEVPAGGYQWIRMNITSGTTAPQVKLKEIRLYQSSNDQTTDLDMMTIYGDSITEGAFYHIGSTGFSLLTSAKTISDDEMIFVPFGLRGQDASGLIEQENIDYDIYDAFAMDNVGAMARYWGIALGANDLGGGDADLGIEGTLLESFDERLEEMVQLLISQNKVPIIARISDTDEELIGPASFLAKKKILDDIDRIAAKYRLIPGPDHYTPMRLNIERDDSSWFWPGDPYHQNWPGRLVIIDKWVDAFIQGTNRVAAGTTPPPTSVPPPTATSVPTETPTSVPPPTATSVPTETPTPTSVPTEPPPTATSIPTETPTATSMPTESPTATGVPTEMPIATSVSAETPLATSVSAETPLATIMPTETPTATSVLMETPLATSVSTGTPLATSVSTGTPVATIMPAGTPAATSGPTATSVSAIVTATARPALTITATATPRATTQAGTSTPRATTQAGTSTPVPTLISTPAGTLLTDDKVLLPLFVK